MSNNIEEVISLRALEEMQARLQDRIDPRTWTVENRDSELQAVWDTAESIVAESTPITLKVLGEEVDGHPFVYWNLFAQVTGSLLEYLDQARRDMDYLDPQELAALPIDERWLTAKIRELIPSYQRAKANVDQVLQSLMKDPMIESVEI